MIKQLNLEHVIKRLVYGKITTFKLLQEFKTR